MDRFETKVARTGECHRWTGSHNAKGYGHFKFEGKTWKAHLFALYLAGIEVPPGMTVDHVWTRGCRFKDCVRLDHLEIVSNHENILRGNNLCARNARKTHCKSGHEFTPENTLIVNKGQSRRCRQCNHAAQQAYRERKNK